MSAPRLPTGTSRLGSGAFADVWEADGGESALKLARDGSPAARRRFAREAEALRACAGPGVVALRGQGTRDGRPYLLLGRVAGAPLLAALAARGVRHDLAGERAWPLLAPVMVQLLRTLARIHEAGWAHGDVSPRNVLLGAQPVLIDFGQSRRTHRSARAEFGTPGFQAPERVVHAPADVYAAACLCCVALTGAGPEQGLGRLPPPLRDALSPALSGDPSRRPTAGRLADRLDAVRLDAGEPLDRGGAIASARRALREGRGELAARLLAPHAGDPVADVLLAEADFLASGDELATLSRLGTIRRDSGAAAEARAAAAYRIGRIHLANGRASLAEQVLREADATWRAAGHEDLALMAANGIAYALLVGGRVDAARDLLESLVAGCVRPPGAVLDHLATACFQACDGEGALAWRERAVARFREEGDVQNLAQALAMLAFERIRLGGPGGDELGDALAIAEAQGLHTARIVALVASSEERLAADELGAARQHARQALELAERIGRPRLIGTAATALAGADARLGGDAERTALRAFETLPIDPLATLGWEARARLAARIRGGERWAAEARELALAHAGVASGWAAQRAGVERFLAFPRAIAPLGAALSREELLAAWAQSGEESVSRGDRSTSAMPAGSTLRAASSSPDPDSRR